MVVVKGRFDGRNVVLDDPVPQGIPANTPVSVVFESEGAAASSALADLARLARPAGLPADFAEQHEHYVKGTPRKEP